MYQTILNYKGNRGGRRERGGKRGGGGGRERERVRERERGGGGKERDAKQLTKPMKEYAPTITRLIKSHLLHST